MIYIEGQNGEFNLDYGVVIKTADFGENSEGWLCVD